MLDGRFGAENWNCGKPGAFTASAGTSMPSCRPDVARDERAPAIAIVDAEAAAELVDDTAGKDSRPPGRQSRRRRRAIEQPQVGQPGAAIPAGAFERECVRGSILPARADEDRVLLRQLVVDATVSAFAAAIERKDLAVGAESAIRAGGLIRQRIEEVDDAARRRIDALRRNAVTGERCTGHADRER